MRSMSIRRWLEPIHHGYIYFECLELNKWAPTVDLLPWPLHFYEGKATIQPRCILLWFVRSTVHMMRHCFIGRPLSIDGWKTGKTHSRSPKHKTTTCMKENPKSLFHEGLHKMCLFFFFVSFFINIFSRKSRRIYDQSNFFTNTYSFQLSATLTLKWALVIVGFIIICTICWSLRHVRQYFGVAAFPLGKVYGQFSPPS